MSRTPTRSNKEGFVYKELQPGRRGTRSARGVRRSYFSSFENLVFEDQEPEEIAKYTNFSEDLDIFGNSSSELPVIEETPKDQFVPTASTNNSPTVVQGIKTYQRKATKPN